MSNVQVYQDIINLIIDDVAASYHDGASVKNHPLLSCASGLSVIPPAGRRITSSRDLRSFSRMCTARSPPTGYRTKKIVRLVDILKGNPVIAPSVRILVIRENQQDTSTDDISRTQPLGEGKPCIDMSVKAAVGGAAARHPSPRRGHLGRCGVECTTRMHVRSETLSVPHRSFAWNFMVRVSSFLKLSSIAST